MQKLLTITEFAERYGVSRSTVYRLFDSGDLTPVKIGRSTRISVDEAEQWLEHLMASQSGEAA